MKIDNDYVVVDRINSCYGTNEQEIFTVQDLINELRHYSMDYKVAVADTKNPDVWYPLFIGYDCKK